MKYCDLRPALEAIARDENVTAVLRKSLGESGNTPEIIEIAYDLQAGSYVDLVRKNSEDWYSFTGELARILGSCLSEGDSVLEAGTGEMTTLAGVANACYEKAGGLYACDISWSRIRKGRGFVEATMRGDLQPRLDAFVADMFHLPFRDKSIDVIWTSHALEPNGGREREIIKELFRVARKQVVLFEPSYENNSEEGRARMSSLGYIRGLPQAIVDMGGRLETVEPISAVSNPLNPTFAYIVRVPVSEVALGEDEAWACPSTGLPMQRRDDCFWSCESRLAYPIIQGIPVLRPSAAVLASAFE
jgi:ubiquinone/menaquinone biosynthesis C-methylase UbiE/uncharacterized protein YbaR (Trm112 family)